MDGYFLIEWGGDFVRLIGLIFMMWFVISMLTIAFKSDINTPQKPRKKRKKRDKNKGDK